MSRRAKTTKISTANDLESYRQHICSTQECSMNVPGKDHKIYQNVTNMYVCIQKMSSLWKHVKTSASMGIGFHPALPALPKSQTHHHLGARSWPRANHWSGHRSTCCTWGPKGRRGTATREGTLKDMSAVTCCHCLEKIWCMCGFQFTWPEFGTSQICCDNVTSGHDVRNFLARSGKKTGKSWKKTHGYFY